MKRYLIFIFLLLASYSEVVFSADVFICSDSSASGYCNSSFTSCYATNGVGTQSLTPAYLFSFCHKFLDAANNVVLSSCPNGSTGYICNSVDSLLSCDSLSCPADKNKSCKTATGTTTTLMCLDVMCPDGSTVPNGQQCPIQCPDGTTVAADGVCSNVICPDGSQVPNGQVCPLESHNQTCPDGSVIPITDTCPSKTQNCPDGSILPYGEQCPIRCPDGSISQNCSSPIDLDCRVGSPYGVTALGTVCTLNNCSLNMGLPVCSSSSPVGSRCVAGARLCADSTICPDGSITLFPPFGSCPSSGGSSTGGSSTGDTGTSSATAGSYSRGQYKVPENFSNSQEVQAAKDALNSKITEIKSSAQSFLVDLQPQNFSQCGSSYHLNSLDLDVHFCLFDYVEYFQKLGSILVFASYLVALFIILG